MNNLTAHQEYLLLGKVSNTLNENESKEWEEMVQQLPEVAAAYEHFIDQLPHGQVETAFSYVDEPGYWDDLTASFKEKESAALPQAPAKLRRLSLFRTRWVAAAIISTIIVGSFFLWNEFRQPGNQDVATNKRPNIELRLANGNVINLSQQQGSIQTDAAQLNNANKTLTYSTGNNPAAVAINTLTVPIGLDYKINLADGTEVWMNSATELKFPMAFPGNTREVTINGEAYLKVAKDAKKPFIVHLPHSTVQVLGTEFNVNSYDSGVVKVALVEGSVNMQTPTDASKLLPGKQAVYHDGQPITQEVFDAKFVLGWQKGLFYFDEVTLLEIAKVVPRWFGMQIVIDDPSINHKKFVGVLDRNQPISNFQDDLKLISGIDSYIDKDNVLHFR